MQKKIQVRCKMKTWNAGLLVLSLSVLLVTHTAVQGRAAEEELTLASQRELDLQCLREAYAGIVEGMEEDEKGIWLRLSEGRRVLYAAAGTPPAPISPASTVAQSMAQAYPLEPARPQPAAGEAPGRSRSQAFLHAVYGQDRNAVRRDLEMMGFAGQGVLFTNRAGAADALRRVAAAMDVLLRDRPEFLMWVRPLGGSFTWRKVAGEQRLSAHSFGVALDLNPERGAYWRWSGGDGHPSQRNFPTEIVKIFEDNGFIWGGKWREYDVMHFEYRPEVICKARKLQEQWPR